MQAQTVSCWFLLLDPPRWTLWPAVTWLWPCPSAVPPTQPLPGLWKICLSSLGLLTRRVVQTLQRTKAWCWGLRKTDPSPSRMSLSPAAVTTQWKWQSPDWGRRRSLSLWECLVRPWGRFESSAVLLDFRKLFERQKWKTIWQQGRFKWVWNVDGDQSLAVFSTAFKFLPEKMVYKYDDRCSQIFV